MLAASPTRRVGLRSTPNGVRKRKLFKPEHIRKAMSRLQEQNWLNFQAKSS
ncbi:hypothetical protein ACF3DV_02535 [Chlorogloeopsis fritschii PCC 9212]|uniref:hypothetical protein n=1 Tax=Chlorogloeopsis fritschii TaxID=1124 RepID=UPI0002E662AB|nr:hypothetical protein [Chlorogloeopsis fritschii]MBF2007206.1 hypothetical protein [Chlorogloeopsis fritschii C42_A2020_084]